MTYGEVRLIFLILFVVAYDVEASGPFDMTAR